MFKFLTIIGTRPQIIKAAALNRAIHDKYSDKLKEVIVHTGQHYDPAMSQVFFDELQIPAPDYNLNIGSGPHGSQTAAMIAGTEQILEKEKPGCIVLYGDTNSTLAASIAASKMQIPIVHIEAGLRSFNKTMPEEINRILCDHVSSLLFAPTKAGYSNLLKEGFRENNKAPYSADNPKIYHCGDVMYDNSLFFSSLASEKSGILEELSLKPGQFILATIHRNTNTDDPKRLTSLFSSMLQIADKISIVLPLHPRTANVLDKNLSPAIYKKVKENPFIKIIPPASFFQMIVLEKNCKLVMTDSGGVQKEAYFFKKPCIILRSETEWMELTESGNAVLTGTDAKKIVEAYSNFSMHTELKFPELFGNGKAAEFICGEILNLEHTKITK